jgi:hypothetical protein
MADHQKNPEVVGPKGNGLETTSSNLLLITIS